MTKKWHRNDKEMTKKWQKMTTQIQNDKPKCKKMQQTCKKNDKIIILEFPMFAGPRFSNVCRPKIFLILNVSNFMLCLLKRSVVPIDLPGWQIRNAPDPRPQETVCHVYVCLLQPSFHMPNLRNLPCLISVYCCSPLGRYLYTFVVSRAWLYLSWSSSW